MSALHGAETDSLAATIATHASVPAPKYLHLTLPDGGTREIPLAGPHLVVGRNPDADVVVAHGSVSRRHALFEPRGDDWWVRDLGSSNGTRIRGAAVTEHRLEPGDRVTLGDAVFTFHSSGDPAAPAPRALRRFAVALSRGVELVRREASAWRARRSFAALERTEFEASKALGDAASLLAPHHPEIAALPEFAASTSGASGLGAGRSELGHAVFRLGLAPLGLAELSARLDAIVRQKLQAAEALGSDRRWLRAHRVPTLASFGALLLGFLLLVVGARASSRRSGFDTAAVADATPRVAVVAETKDQEGILYYQLASGTAFAIESRGYLLTNRHVVADLDKRLARFQEDTANLVGKIAAQGRVPVAGLARLHRNLRSGVARMKVYACFSDEEIYEARVVHKSADADLAILAVDEKLWSACRPEWPHLRSARAEDARETLRVAAVGYPGIAESVYESGEEVRRRFLEGSATVAGACARTAFKPTWTVGVISKIADHVTNGSTKGRVVQTDASLNHGNSGGPLIDEENRVLAINTFGAETVFGALLLADLEDEIAKAIRADARTSAAPPTPRRRSAGGR